jgi:hypothetical protein
LKKSISRAMAIFSGRHDSSNTICSIDAEIHCTEIDATLEMILHYPVGNQPMPHGLTMLRIKIEDLLPNKIHHSGG